MMVERKYEKEAATVTKAIKKMAADEVLLENFESYLSIHFEAWMKKYAADPAHFAAEFEAFSEIE